MINVYKKIYVGNNMDAEKILSLSNSNWSILHCTKTYHKKLVGYTGCLPSDDPRYLEFIIDERMALNLVDMPYLNTKYFGPTKIAFKHSFAFLDEQIKLGNNILIHCDQGHSRGPFVAMLYLASLGVYDYKDFDSTLEKFKIDYLDFVPESKKNIYVMVKMFWSDFVKAK